ncbi:hypothetical protein BC828DRAFT_407238, partial [Blastocladiella britannica]
LEDESWYRVEAILDARWINRVFKYKVRWLGYDAKDDTWESAIDLQHHPLTAAFHVQYPSKPRPDAPPPTRVRRAPTASTTITTSTRTRAAPTARAGRRA